MDRIQSVNISAFIIPTSYLHTDCRLWGDGAGAVYYSWNILGGEGRSQYPSAEWLNMVKRERATPGDLWGGKLIVWGAAQFRLCFPGAWVVMTWLVSPLNCWPLQCLDFLVTPLWRAPFTQECLPSCRSSSRAAVLRSWTQHHALWERIKQWPQEE